MRSMAQSPAQPRSLGSDPSWTPAPPRDPTAASCKTAAGESGEAAVSVVVDKAKAEAAHAKKAAAAESAAAATGADKEKAALKNLYFHKLQHDNGIRSIEIELKRLREVLIKLRGEEKKLKDIGQDGRHLIQLSEEQRELRLKQLSEEQREFRQQQKKLREEEAKLRQQQKEFCLEHGSLAAEEEEPEVPSQRESVQGNDNAGGDNVNGGCHSDGYGSVPSYHDGERRVHADGAYYVYHERQGNNNNGGRQGYPQVHNKRWVYVVKGTKLSSGDVDHKAEEVTSDAGTEAKHKPAEEATTNAGANPSSGSEKSSAAGYVFRKAAIQKNKLSGSQKRKKKKNAAKKNCGNGVDKAKKQDSSEVDVSKKTDKEPLADYPREEEKKTLAEYEKIRQEKKKSLEDVSRTERKVSTEEFKGLQMLEKKKLGDEEAVMKEEKVQKKAKDAGNKEEKAQPEAKDADDAKSKKAVKLPLKDLSFASPKRVVIYEDGSSNRGRFNGGYQSRNHDNGTDSRVPAAGRAANYGNGSPRGGYSGGRGIGAPSPRGDYSGGNQGNGGYHNQGSNGYQRRQGNDNYYRPRGRGYSGNGCSPAPNPKDMNLFPQLPASAPARAATPVAAPAQS